MWMKCTFCKVGTTFLYIMDINLMLQKFNSVRTLSFFSEYFIKFRCSVAEKRGLMYVATNNHKSAEQAAVVLLFLKCRKCLTLLLRSVLDVRNVFHILDF